MIRRLFLALIGAVVIVCGLTACTTSTPPVSPKANSYVAPPEGITPAPPETSAPVPYPPLPSSIPPLAAVSLDTTGFDQPASIMGWKLLGDQKSIIVVIGITQRDWQILAKETHLNAQTDLPMVQMDQTTASSLVNLDSLATDVQSDKSVTPPVKLSELYQVYVLSIVDVT